MKRVINFTWSRPADGVVKVIYLNGTAIK